MNYSESIQTQWLCYLFLLQSNLYFSAYRLMCGANEVFLFHFQGLVVLIGLHPLFTYPALLPHPPHPSIHTSPSLSSLLLKEFFFPSFPPLHCAGLERSEGARREDLLLWGETDRGEGPWLLSQPCWRPGLSCRHCAWLWPKWWVDEGGWDLLGSGLPLFFRVSGDKGLQKGPACSGHLGVMLQVVCRILCW